MQVPGNEATALCASISTQAYNYICSGKLRHGTCHFYTSISKINTVYGDLKDTIYEALTYTLVPWKPYLWPWLSITTKKQAQSGLNGLDNLYIPTSSLAICFFILEDGSPSAETCFDTEQSACPQAAAFLSRCTCITPSTYVYTSFVSDLVLAKSVAVGKTPRQALLFDRLLYWLHMLPSL